jgi:hypothetical protein
VANLNNDNLSHARKPPVRVVLVKALAKEMEMHPTSIRRDLKRRGYPMFKRRMPSSPQMAHAITVMDAERYRAERAAEGFVSVEGTVGPEHQVAELLMRMRRDIDQVFEDGAREIAALLKAE